MVLMRNKTIAVVTVIVTIITGATLLESWFTNREEQILLDAEARGTLAYRVSNLETGLEDLHKSVVASDAKDDSLRDKVHDLIVEVRVLKEIAYR